MYINEQGFVNFSEKMEYKIVLKKPFGEPIAVLKEGYNKEFNLNIVGVNEFNFTMPTNSLDADKIKVSKFLDVELIHPEKKDDRGNIIDQSFYKEEMVITNVRKMDSETSSLNITAKSNYILMGKRIIENYSFTASKIYRTDLDLSTFTPGQTDEGVEYETYEEFETSGLINHAMKRLPDWTIEEVNFDENDAYRTTDFTEISVLEIFTDFIPKNYELFPLFDTINKKISFVPVSQLGTDVGLAIENNKIAQQIEVNYTNNEFVTQLYVYGEDGKTIAANNPAGKKYITDMSPFMTTEYMPQDLIDSLNDYNTTINNKEGELQNLLSTLYNHQSQLESLKSSQSALKAEIESLENELDDFVSQYAGTDPSTWPARDSSIINSEIETKRKELENYYTEVFNLSNALDQSVNLSESYQSGLKVNGIIRDADTGDITPRTKTLSEDNGDFTFDGTSLISGLDGTELYSIAVEYNATYSTASYEEQINDKESEIEQDWTNINNLKESLDVSNYLTQEQVEQLQSYVYSRVYRNENISNGQKLYEKGLEILESLNTPKVKVEVDAINIYEALEFQTEWDKVRLGNIVTVISESIPGGSVKMRIIGIAHKSDSNEMTLTLSNSTSVDDDTFELEEMLNKANKTTVDVSVNSSKYGAYVDSGERNELVDYINNELDLAAQKAVAGKNQNVIIDQHGISINNTVDNLEKMKILNNLLVLTRDNFETADVAISPQGIVAERLIGKVIAGNKLTISNADSTFIVDGQGVQINGGSLTITNRLPNEITDYVGDEIQDVTNTTDNLQSQLNVYSDDLKITQLEANSINNLLQQVKSESADLINIANNLNNEAYINIQTQIDDYNTSLNNLETFLNTNIITGAYPHNITATDRADIESKFSTLQSDKSSLIKAINESIETKSNQYTEDNALIKGRDYNNFKFTAEDGVVVTKNDSSAKTTLNATDGIKLQTSTDGGTSWNTNLIAKTDGTLALDSVIATNFTLDGGTMKVGSETLIDSNGNIDFTNFNTIGTDPRLLEGIEIKDGSGNTTFSVDTSGSVVLAGSINWTQTNSDPSIATAQSTADDAKSTALSAEGISKKIADGEYSGTFIDNEQIISPTISSAVINSGIINSIKINSADIDISENVSIGDQLIINASNVLSGIEWRDSYGEEYAEIYIDPASSSLFLEANSGGNIYANGKQVLVEGDTVTAAFG